MSGSGSVGARGLGLEAALESREVLGHLLGCLSSHQQWDEDLADAMPFEVDVDREAAAGLTDGLHGDVDSGADRSVDTAHRPAGRRVELGQDRRRGPVGAADAPHHLAVGPYSGWAGFLDAAGDDALLPLVELGGSVT